MTFGQRRIDFVTTKRTGFKLDDSTLLNLFHMEHVTVDRRLVSNPVSLPKPMVLMFALASNCIKSSNLLHEFICLTVLCD